MANKWILATFFFFPALSYASTIDLYLSGGAAFSNLTTNKNIQINNFVTNTYDTESNNTTSFLGGVGVGHSFENIYQKPFSLSLGVMAYYLNFGKFEGIEYPFSNAGQFDTLRYQFEAESFVTMIESHLAYTKYALEPFILLGIGASWNHLYNYSNTPTDPNGSAVSSPDVNSSTKTSFAYEAGLGVQYMLSKNQKNHAQWLVSLDYRYLNSGKGELGSFPSQTVDDSLSINDLDTQAVVLTLKVTV